MRHTRPRKTAARTRAPIKKCGRASCRTTPPWWRGQGSCCGTAGTLFSARRRSLPTSRRFGRCARRSWPRSTPPARRASCPRRAPRRTRGRSDTTPRQCSASTKGTQSTARPRNPSACTCCARHNRARSAPPCILCKRESETANAPW